MQFEISFFSSEFHLRRITSYTTAFDDIASSQETPANLNEEQDTGCTVITQEDDEIIQTQSADTANASQISEDLLKFDEVEIKDESNSVTVTAQPSNSSVITVSSDGSQETTAHNNPDNSIEIKDEEMFERSISQPPMQLPDELFEDSTNDIDDQEIETDHSRMSYKYTKLLLFHYFRNYFIELSII